MALLIALNVIGIVLTRRFLSLGLEEGNPLMAVAVRSWGAAAGKVAILAGLAWSFAKRPATATRLVLVWTGVGLYLLAAYVNLSAIQAAEAALSLRAQMPWSAAQRISSARRERWSLFKMLRTWFSTVFSEMNSWAPTCL